VEKQERETIQRIVKSNEELKRLYHQHQLYEQKLARYESRSFLTPAEQLAMRTLKKKKLSGVDRMMMILSLTDSSIDNVAH
jgi:uncharacterized protein YdcH (DUF465 family)